MRAIVRYALGVATAVNGIVALPSAVAGQAAGPTACSLIDAAELKRLTGRTDILGQGPLASDPSETPKGVSECEFLGFSFSLTTPMTREGFDATRSDQGKRGTKIQPVSGVGDDGYYWWDPQPGSLRQVGIAFRSGKSRLVIMDMVSSDSVDAVKPVILTVAKAVAAKVR